MDVTDNRNKVEKHPLASLLLVLGSVLLILVLLEAAARVWVHLKWSDRELSYYTEDVSAEFGYVPDPETGYRLEPGDYKKDNKGKEFSHNSLGFRGKEFSTDKPRDELRVVLMGGSTVYGIFVGDSETCSARLEGLLKETIPGGHVSVINAGVPGWTSRETLINLKRKVLALYPDVIIVMDGRNELFPELFNNYTPDYSHYRDLGFNFIAVNTGYRKLFRFSRLALLLMAGRNAGDGRFGFSRRAGHPTYGYNRWENVPSVEQIIGRVNDDQILSGFRNNLDRIAEITAAAGIRLILASIPFDPAYFRSGVIKRDPRILDALNLLMERNNAVTREVAERHNLPFVDVASLSSHEYLVDDCHFNGQGELRAAQMMADTIHSILP